MTSFPDNFGNIDFKCFWVTLNPWHPTQAKGGMFNDWDKWLNIKTADSHGILKPPREVILPLTCSTLVCAPSPISQCAVYACHSRSDVLGWFHSPTISLASWIWVLRFSVVCCWAGGRRDDLLAWDHPMKIRMGRMPGDAPVSLSYASGNKSHVPCVGECVKLTPFTRCSRVLWALQGLLLSNTYLKKVKLACSEWKDFVLGFFFFPFNSFGWTLPHLFAQQISSL